MYERLVIKRLAIDQFNLVIQHQANHQELSGLYGQLLPLVAKDYEIELKKVLERDLPESSPLVVQAILISIMSEATHSIEAQRYFVLYYHEFLKYCDALSSDK